VLECLDFGNGWSLPLLNGEPVKTAALQILKAFCSFQFGHFLFLSVYSLFVMPVLISICIQAGIFVGCATRLLT